MKIWRLSEPFETTYAEAWLRSPPVLKNSPVCEYCGWGAEYEYPRPLVFEWAPGSEIIGDFVWPLGGRVAVQRHVFETLSRCISGIEAGPVEMVQDSKLTRPSRKTKRAKPRVWLPYDGPELVELWVERSVHLAPGSATEVFSTCRKCGRETLNWSGVETKQHVWDKKQMKLVPLFIPRDPGRGLRVRASDVADTPIFKTVEFPTGILCTDAAKKQIEREQFTNIDFLDYGDLI